MHIHPHTTGLQLSRHPLRPLNILTPHTSPQTILRIISPRNDIILITPLHGGEDGPKWLFNDDAGIVGWVVDDGGRDEVAIATALGFSIGAGIRGPDSGFPAFFPDVGEEGLDFFVLNVVLKGANEVCGISGGADFEVCGIGDHGGEEAVVDFFVDVDTFDVHADLAGVEEGEGGDL